MKIFNKNFNSVGISLLVFVVLFSFVVEVSAAPHISCTNTTYNFNASNGVAEVEHTFVLANTGDEDLVFGQVRSCCGAKTSLRNKTVAPGSNTTLNVKLSIRGRRGKVSKSIYVPSNDPSLPYMQLKLAGFVSSPVSSVTTTRAPSKPVVVGDILAVPKEICVTSGTNRKEPVVRYLALRSRKNTPFKILEVKLPVEGMTHTLTALGNAGWRIEIANIIPDSKLNGEEITILTDREDQPTITVPFRVVGDH